ncbi:MAG: hemolysin family protein [Bacteroidota bacterium]
MGLLITFFCISIIFSFLCSIWEAALLSITPSFAEIKFQENTTFGNRLKSFKDNIDRPLSAILTLNTIAHTVGAIGVGVAATKVWPDNEIITGAVVPVVMTLMILILSEIIPKTLGANYWKQLSGFTVNSLHWIIIALYPLVWVSQQITRFLKKDKKKSVFSRADFTAMAELGAKQGVFKKSESRIMQNLLRFNTVQVKDIMTPRTVVKASKESNTLQEFYDANPNLRFSRIPVYKDSKDNINGYFLKDELLSNMINGNSQSPLSSIMRPITIVNEQLPIPDLFNRLMESREQVALVVDEFGGMAGLVTMEDVIETLLGMEIVDEFDNIEDMQAWARKNWEKRARNLGILTDEPGDENPTVNTSTKPDA